MFVRRPFLLTRGCFQLEEVTGFEGPIVNFTLAHAQDPRHKAMFNIRESFFKWICCGTGEKNRRTMLIFCKKLKIYVNDRLRFFFRYFGGCNLKNYFLVNSKIGIKINTVINIDNPPRKSNSQFIPQKWTELINNHLNLIVQTKGIFCRDSNSKND